MRADKIGKEFGINYIIKGSGDEYQALNDIKKAGNKTDYSCQVFLRHLMLRILTMQLLSPIHVLSIMNWLRPICQGFQAQDLLSQLPHLILNSVPPFLPI